MKHINEEGIEYSFIYVHESVSLCELWCLFFMSSDLRVLDHTMQTCETYW